MSQEKVTNFAQERACVVTFAEKTGRDALEKLRSEGIDSAVFHELDITSQQSVDEFASWLEQNHGGLDILVSLNPLSDAVVVPRWFYQYQ